MFQKIFFKIPTHGSSYPPPLKKKECQKKIFLEHYMQTMLQTYRDSEKIDRMNILGEPMKILVIDDSGFSRMQMKNILKQVTPDAQILEADGAQKAIEIYDQEIPELVLTDLVMPEIKGDAVVRHVRSQSSDTFVAVVSANVQDRVQDEMKDLGANYFLEKPIKLEKVQALLEVYRQTTST